MLQNLKLSFILPQLTEHGDQSLQDVTAQWGSTCKEIFHILPKSSLLVKWILLLGYID